jgi:hypothetical protein
MPRAEKRQDAVVRLHISGWALADSHGEPWPAAEGINHRKNRCIDINISIFNYVIDAIR